MINVAERVKKAIFDKGWTQKKLCGEIDITETGFKRMLDSNSWKLDTLEKMASALDKPVVYFIEETEQNLDRIAKSTERQFFGEEVIEELKAMFEEELRIKNQQIAGLQRTVDVLVGKSEGAADEPLSEYAITVLGMLDQYRAKALGLLAVPATKVNEHISKVGGTRFSHAENALIIK